MIETERKLWMIGEAMVIMIRYWGEVPGWIDELRAEVEAGVL